MPTGLYAKGRAAFLAADIDWLADDIRVIFIDAALYTVDLAADEFLSAIAAGARVAVSTALAGKSATLGVADASDKTIAAVAGAQFEALVLYQHTGVDATSRLIAYIDNYSGLPCTPVGTDIPITWPEDANKIFKL
jgi:hypothetical protein